MLQFHSREFIPEMRESQRVFCLEPKGIREDNGRAEDLIQARAIGVFTSTPYRETRKLASACDNHCSPRFFSNDIYEIAIWDACQRGKSARK
jgi:hypothetical protein